MIFDEISSAMNADSTRRISRKTGLDKEKIRRMAAGLPFVLDRDTEFALSRMGLEIKLVRKK